ncbi:MAG: hypothetical protein RLZZ598_1926 [Pseudomonadota bacterium]|jgi:dolichol kinase
MILAQGVIAVASVVALFGMADGVRRLGQVRGWSPETQRKTVHVGVGVHAMALPLVVDRSGFLMFVVLALGALVILRLPSVRSEGAGASIHAVGRRSWGDVLFLVAVTVLFLRAAGDPALYTLPLAVLTLSDAAAAVIGTQYGRRWFGGAARTKSVEGTVTFFVITWMLAVAILIQATPVPRPNVVALATVVAAMAAVIEAESWHGLDNLFVPVGVHILLMIWGEANPLILGTIALSWLVALSAASRLSAWLGVTRHTVRILFITLFLTATVTGVVGAMPTALAVLGYLAARVRLVTDATGHDLDFVAVLVLVGIFWLGVGALTHVSALDYFTMTCCALAAGYAVLAVGDRPEVLRLAAAGAAIGAVVVIHQSVSGVLAPEAHWRSTTVTAVGCTLSAATCTLAAVWRPRLVFGAAAPAWRLAGLALLVPIVTYAGELWR